MDKKQLPQKRSIYYHAGWRQAIYLYVYPQRQYHRSSHFNDPNPLFCSPYSEDNFRNFWSNHNRQYFKDGYIIVIQDVRGRWMSEGQFEDVRPFNADKRTKKDIDESSDTYDTIDWLVKSVAHNNGKVGVFGISYPGFYSTMAAASNHPALKAVSPQAPVTEWFLGDDFHHNGALSLIDAFSFYSSFGKPRPKPTIVGPSGFTFPVQDNYAFFLRTGALPNFSALMGDSIAFWKDLYSHLTMTNGGRHAMQEEQCTISNRHCL